ncbi:MAG: site-specific recombinase [Fluviicoccus sp.]|uniref:site-specific recombinase n=1 Tax=Fluviicoccus sp. TaxID=2003552 RepID=UPI002718ADA3|nr:site-specific recombinase [Fluviicoccus sp.]MDO8329631.1 site-specific recombinase [Fluviicoccus sp.]
MHSALLAAFRELPAPDALRLLVNDFRPTEHHIDAEGVNAHWEQTLARLQPGTELAQVVSRTVQDYLRTVKQVPLYTDSAVPGSEGFFTALSQRLGWKLLPPARHPDYLKDQLTTLFPRPQDSDWLMQVRAENWQALFDWLAPHGELRDAVQMPLLDALAVLACRIAAMGLEPDLVRIHPAIEEHSSPFLALNREVADYVRSHHATPTEPGAPPTDEKHLPVLAQQCHDVLLCVRRNISRTGVSISLTYLLERLEKHLQRLDDILVLLNGDRTAVGGALGRLLPCWVKAEVRRGSVRALVAANTRLLSLRVTEHAGETGDHYVTTNRDGFFRMLRSAMGAGVIIGVMALLKLLAGGMQTSLFGHALLYSLNYALGFMLIHLLHFTIATKQPAMTAARLAATLDHPVKGRHNLNELAELTVNIFRTQFIAVAGNMLVAFPVAAALGWWWLQGGEPLASPAKAQTLLTDLNPFHSLALFHAAIAGVCLFLAGLISGYHDNFAIYRQLAARIEQHPGLQWLSGARRQQLGHYLEHNLGALAGNFYFGWMLGCIGTLGIILGLPLDIRHVTFSTANLAFATWTPGLHLPLSVFLTCLLGVGLIGMVNVLVSFSLALLVAMRARGVRFLEWGALTRLLWLRLVRRPRDFFWPPADQAPKDM